jgi:hypothetical protein
MCKCYQRDARTGCDWHSLSCGLGGSSDGSVCEPGHLGDRQFGLFQGHGAPYGFGLGPLENGATAHEFVGGGRLRKRFAHPVFVGHVAVRAGHLNIRMPSFAERAYVCRDPGQDRILRDRTQDVQGMTPVTRAP